MDDKKQNLTPELKQIYERVMNTKAQPSAATQTQAPPVKIQVASAVPDITTPTNQPATPLVPPQPAVTSASQISQAQTLPTQMPQSIIPPQSATQTPTGTTQTPQANTPFLSSVPPRPISNPGDTPFTFSSKGTAAPNKNAQTPPAAPAAAHAPQPTSHPMKSNSKMLSSKIIMLLVGVLLIAWGIFWAKFFKFF